MMQLLYNLIRFGTFLESCRNTLDLSRVINRAIDYSIMMNFNLKNEIVNDAFVFNL